VIDILEWLSATMPAAALRRSGTLYMFVNAAHILAIGLLIGAILPLDLKLVGFSNPAFLAKLGLIAFGLLNVLVVHAGQGWRTATTVGILRPAIRVSAALSAATWIAALVAGRWIGFL
jgi:hypothetical protein